jgi:hypothetical protein
MPPLHRLAQTLVLLAGGLVLAGGPGSSDLERRRSFVPAGWEVGDCPASYGRHAVLCGAIDSGPLKVDRHIPTVWVDAPPTSCAETEKALLARWEGKMTVTRRLTGRCGPAGAPCTELRFKDPRPVDPVGPLTYLLCPASGPVELVQYAVSAKVIDQFEPVARAQMRWTPGK